MFGLRFNQANDEVERLQINNKAFEEKRAKSTNCNCFIYPTYEKIV